MLQLVCSLFTAILSYFWNSNFLDGHWYLNDSSQINQYGLLGILFFFTYFLLYNTMIPISLIVSLEMVKVAQGYFITKDKQMYCEAKDIWPKVMTTTINEELGQVEYIFSDKTGTLTCNVMEFNKSVIGNKLYGDSGKQNPNKKKEQKNEGGEKKIKLTNFNFYDEELNDLLSQAKNDKNIGLKLTSEDGRVSYTIQTQRDLACEYWKLLSSAHECIIQKDKETGEIDYQGPSPDEITLVDAARHMGFAFQGASSDSIDLNVRGVKEKLRLFNSFEFNSDRKRMSVIVKDGDIYKLYIKGADSIIKSRLHQNKPQPFLEQINDYLTQFSLIGLRTLMMAMKILSEEEYQDFKRSMTALAGSDNREKEMDMIADKLERNLILLGATAVEDKLQDKVPETIYDMIKANIKVWMLTGDKLETAENIAKSCKLIQSDMHVMQISEKEEQELKNNLLGTTMEKFLQLKSEKQKKSLLVEGDSLTIIFNDQNLKQAFLKISKDCESVVCCRVTPKQKALVVRLIKDNLKKITLAIGDGANDVNMIQEAHIGCGIFGNEGMQAAQSSDFAFGEFKCLWRLVLVHGRWSYIRIAEMIIYFFYKNMLFTIPQLYFSFFNAYSGQTIFDAWYISLYNLIFTAVPLISRAIFDQDINYKVSVDQVKMGDQDTRLQKIIERKEEYLEKKYPTFYYTSQDKTIFTDGNFISWMVQGLVHGIIIFFSTYFCFDAITFAEEGYSTDLWSFSLIIFTSIVLVANLKIAMYTRYWTWVTYFSFIFMSLFLYFAFLLGSQAMETSEVYLTPFEMFKRCQFYFIILFTCGLILAFDMVVYVSKQFLTTQKILGYMRFIKNPQISLDRKPSWADDMSIFNSFYNIQEKKNSNNGSLYRQNSDLQNKSTLQNNSNLQAQNKTANIQNQNEEQPQPIGRILSNHTSDNYKNQYQPNNDININGNNNKNYQSIQLQQFNPPQNGSSNPSQNQQQYSQQQQVQMQQQQQLDQQKTPHLLLQQQYSQQSNGQQQQQNGMKQQNYQQVQDLQIQQLDTNGNMQMSNQIMYNSVFIILNKSDCTIQVRDQDHFMNSQSEKQKKASQQESNISHQNQIEEIINIDLKSRKSQNHILKDNTHHNNNKFCNGEENVVSQKSVSSRGSIQGSKIHQLTILTQLQNRAEKIDETFCYTDIKNSAKNNKSDNQLILQDPHTPTPINNSIDNLRD